jgi:biotin carboxylase
MNGGMVLLVSSGLQRYREYLLAGACKQRPVWLLDGAASTWQQPYVQGTSIVDWIDSVNRVPDQDGFVRAAASLAAERSVAGVFTYDERLVITTAHIAETLGLPGLSVAGAENCRDKHRTRQVLTAAGVPQPRFTCVYDAAAAREAAAVFGYPVVVKPRGLGASIGVVRALEPADIDRAFAVADRASHNGAPAYRGGVLVEELVTGPEISIDGAAFDGEYRPLFLAHKQLGLEPYFEETGHVVNSEEPLLADERLLDILSQAHRALGIRTGITHTEVKLTQRGPVVIEVNARLGGDLIPHIGELATGISASQVAVDLATGIRPTLEPTAKGCVGIRFCYPPEDGRVRSTKVPRGGDVPGLIEATEMVSPGARLLLPPRGYLNRYAYLVCRADSPTACLAALDEAAALTSVELESLSAA